MSPEASLVGISIPAWMALLVAYWPRVASLRRLLDLRLQVKDKPDAPFRVLVLVRADGYDWFITKLPSKDSE